MEDPTGWWVSEKLDGVRAYWNGQQFISRLGNPFLAPSWFTKNLPSMALDGELWCGRKSFSKTISIVKSRDMGEYWKTIKYKGTHTREGDAGDWKSAKLRGFPISSISFSCVD